jgi:hypothetical protein
VSFTTIANVVGLYPTFKRGVVNQNPPDALIQQFIDDFAEDLISILERRFGETIGDLTDATTAATNTWLATLGLPNQNWYSNTQMNAGTVVLDSNSPAGAQLIVTPGVSGSVVPFFNPNFGGITTDGVALWLNIGQSRQLRVLERGNRYGAAGQFGRVMASFGVASAKGMATEYEGEFEAFKAELNAETIKGEPKGAGQFDVLFDPEASVQTPRPVMMGIAGGDQPIWATADIEGISANFSKHGLDFGRHGLNWGGYNW